MMECHNQPGRWRGWVPSRGGWSRCWGSDGPGCTAWPHRRARTTSHPAHAQLWLSRATPSHSCSTCGCWEGDLPRGLYRYVLMPSAGVAADCSPNVTMCTSELVVTARRPWSGDGARYGMVGVCCAVLRAGRRAGGGQAQQEGASTGACYNHPCEVDKWQQREGLTSRMPNAVAGWSV